MGPCTYPCDRFFVNYYGRGFTYLFGTQALVCYSHLTTQERFHRIIYLFFYLCLNEDGWASCNCCGHGHSEVMVSVTASVTVRRMQERGASISYNLCPDIDYYLVGVFKIYCI